MKFRNLIIGIGCLIIFLGIFNFASVVHAAPPPVGIEGSFSASVSGDGNQVTISGNGRASADYITCTEPVVGAQYWVMGTNLRKVYSVTVAGGSDAFSGQSFNVSSSDYPSGACPSTSSGPNTWDASQTFDSSSLGNGTYNLAIQVCDQYNGTIYGCSPLSVAFTISRAQSCNIRVISNVGTSWNIFGPSNLSGSGTDTTYTSQPTGSYTIDPATLGGYSGPSVSPGSTQDCTNGNTATFTLTYTGSGAVPSVDIKANGSDGPITISNGSSATLSWTSSNADSCSASNAWSGGKATGGSQSTGSLGQGSYTYTITCSNGSGSSNDSVTVNVSAPNSPPSVDLLANGSNGPISVSNGSAVTLSWSTANATSCSASGSWAGAKSASGGSEQTGGLAQGSYTYTITCSGNTAPAASDSVTVNVGAAPNTLPTGFLDEADCNFIAGWTFDPDSSSTSITYRVFDGASLIYQGTADGSRPDVDSAYGISGNHGFNLDTPSSLKDGYSHTVYVYAVDYQDNNQTVQITSSPKSLTCGTPPQPPVGSFDVANCSIFGGWAFDPNSSSNAVAIHFYKDGPAGVGTFVTNTTTDVYRGDVNAAYGITGNHGFGISTPASIFDGASHSIYAYAIDNETPGVATLLGNSPITVNCGGPSDPSNVTYTAPNYCTSGPGGTISWTYNDPNNSPQASYQIQISNTGNFNSPMYDSGQVNSNSTSFAIPNGILQFNVTYKARVRTWNSYSNASGWVTTNSFKTPNYAYPQVSFTYTPARPSKGSPVSFTDGTVFSGPANGRTWSWTFGDSGTSSTQSPNHTYQNTGSFSVQLIATDGQNQSCSTSQLINVQKPIPSIKEVAPK
jgi:hypothetical protein